MQMLKGIYYSFPVQLLLLHLKKNPLLLVTWILLFMIILNNFAQVFGIPFLFLDPEYLGRVGFWSFFLIGAALGVFIATFFITSYILNSFRFPFLATLRHPFATYCINNGLIPAGFLATYFFAVVKFQVVSGLADFSEIFLNVLGLIMGTGIILGLIASYFLHTNKDIYKILGIGQGGHGLMESIRKRTWSRKKVVTDTPLPVQYFLTRKLTIRRVRGVEHYDESLLVRILKQHHINALLIQLIALALLIMLGYFADSPYAIIPAGASILLLLTIIIMLLGAFIYYTRSWQIIALAGIVLLFAIFTNLGALNYRSKAFGLAYDSPYPDYSSETLLEHAQEEHLKADAAYMLDVLENWKEKQQGLSPGEKPKMIFLNATGGGHRAMYWSMQVLQYLDSLSNGNLLRQTSLMTGASGGMIGMAYYRELYWNAQQGLLSNISSQKYLDNIGKDLLNPVSFMIIANDIFYPWRSYNYKGEIFRKDRGYIFEKYLNQNTEGVFDKPLSAYRDAEHQAQIPLLILSPTIINDERKLFISPHPVSFLTRPVNDLDKVNPSIVDGVDFLRFFQSQDAENLRMSSALRMNATYPYVLPAVHLPADPLLQVMDAGIRDNYGFETTARFLNVFSEWINENTSGVIIISINSANKAYLGRERKGNNVMYKLFNPIGNIYANWIELQNYQQKYLLEYSKEWLNGEVTFLEFNYIPEKREEVASMSFHLTTKEKRDIEQAISLPINWQEVERFQELMKK